MKKEITKSKTYTAYYMPSHEDRKDPTQSGFKSKKEAEQYVINHGCFECSKEGMLSACAAEWLVIEEKAYEEAKNFTDLFIAAGYKKINKI